ncbi:hypothetical protein ACLMJK_004146 [Lecanora helva]
MLTSCQLQSLTSLKLAHRQRLRLDLSPRPYPHHPPQPSCPTRLTPFSQSGYGPPYIPEKQAVKRVMDKKHKSEEYDESDEETDEESKDEEEASDRSDEDESDVSRSESGARYATHVPVAGSKRMRSRYATCENCSREFDVTLNSENDCVWHEEEKEADYQSDVWADHDEDCHGRIDELGDEFPEDFIYTCCNRPGDAKGCRIGTHVEGKAPWKKRRF